MKNIIILLSCLYCSQKIYAQCTATQHNITGGTQPFVTVLEGATDHDYTGYVEEDLCSDDGWVLVFEDDFNGDSLDQSIWTGGWCNQNYGNECPSSLSDPYNFSVSGGVLSLTSIYDQINKVTVCPAIQTKRKFPSGEILVRAKMPPLPENQPLDIAPLWMYTYLDYTNAFTADPANKQVFYNEMDVEFMDNSLSTGMYTLHSGNPPGSPGSYSDGAPTSCFGGSMTDGNWHIFEIEWDMYHVNWIVDGTIVNSLSRTYEPIYVCCGDVPVIPIPLYLSEVSECSGPPITEVVDKDWMFPLFANFPILIGGLGNYNGQLSSSDLPYTMQIDYVKFFRKITCDKNLVLPPSDLNPYGGFRSAGGILCDGNGGDQVPPIIDNQTPSILTGGTISAGSSDGSVPYIFRRDDFDWGTQQNLDLLATQSVTLLPGFETDLLYQANGECASPPHTIIGQALGNNWTIQDVFTAGIVSCPDPEGAKPPKPYHYKNISEPTTSFNLNLYPNPANSQCTVQFSIPADANVNITLTDMTGREVGVIDQSRHEMGTAEVPFSTGRYAPGVYLVHFTDGTNTAAQRLTIGGKD